MAKSYEAMFIFSAALKEDAVEKLLERIRADVAKLNGKIVDTQVMGVRAFSRPMQKKDMGLYVRMYLQMDPKDVAGLSGRFRLNEEIFRVQILQREKPVKAVPATAPAAPAV